MRVCITGRTVFTFSATSSKIPPRCVDLAACVLAHSAVWPTERTVWAAVTPDVYQSRLMAGGQVLKKTHFANLPAATLNIPLSLYFFPGVIILWWLCVIIYHRAPLSSVVLSTEPAPAASVRQDYGQLHKHFTDKDGQLFTDEAKVLLAAATVWVWMCVCVLRKCEFVRKWKRERGWWEERGWQREPLMYGHFWFGHLQVSLLGPICRMHLMLLQPWTVL